VFDWATTFYYGTDLNGNVLRKIKTVIGKVSQKNFKQVEPERIIRRFEARNLIAQLFRFGRIAKGGAFVSAVTHYIFYLEESPIAACVKDNFPAASALLFNPLVIYKHDFNEAGRR
jgi:hypothetical protein